MNETRGQPWRAWVIALVIPLAVGGFSALLTKDSMDLYSTVAMPPLSPPGWLFPVVWSVLYLLMGVSSALVWQRGEEEPEAVSRALSVYAVSLGFNFLWSILFFSCRWFLVAFFWLLGLLGLIVATIAAYRSISKTAARLQIPYALWVAFAGYLNAAIWYLNRG